MIAKASTAQNDETGDGTTSTVLIIGELLRQAEIYINDGLHPRVIADGFDLAKKHALKVLNEIRVPLEQVDRQSLIQVAQTALRTKIGARLADQLATICVDAIEAIRQEDRPIDLHMVEIMEMRHRSEEETQLVRGLVLDHGPRHPDMKKNVTNAFILTSNVSLEYEKTTVNAGFFYKSAEEREKLVAAEREFIDQRVQKVIELKNQVCTDATQTFVLVNQQGIDPTSLDLLAKAGIMAIRRAKRRNMERLTLACGGQAVNSFENLSPEVLGHAGQVYEYVLGDEKFTFIEDVKNPKSVTILIKATNKHTLTQIKDAVYDGLRAIKNTFDDKSLVPGAGAFEVAAYASLLKFKAEVKGKAQLGVQAYADALLIIPKTLAANAGHDAQDVIVKLGQEHAQTGMPIGIDLKTGDAIVPADQGIFDNFKVKKQLLNSWSVFYFIFIFHHFAFLQRPCRCNFAFCRIINSTIVDVNCKAKHVFIRTFLKIDYFTNFIFCLFFRFFVYLFRLALALDRIWKQHNDCL